MGEGDLASTSLEVLLGQAPVQERQVKGYPAERVRTLRLRPSLQKRTYSWMTPSRANSRILPSTLHPDSDLCRTCKASMAVHTLAELTEATVPEKRHLATQPAPPVQRSALRHTWNMHLV